MPERRTVKWYELDKVIDGLETDVVHEIQVQREAIPLIFVPGIMGSRLKRTGTDPEGETDGLPNMRWEPGKKGWMWKHYSGKDPLYRKNMLVGPAFDPNFLEVDNSTPTGDGFQGIMEDYVKFLKKLKTRNWGPLHKIFEFPVYAFGYNWTDSSRESGEKLAQRISAIISEAQEITGFCEKVILITHSMGGIVARSASELHGAQPLILGIIQGVQPVTGAAAAYWRIKGGFEGSWFSGHVAGSSRALGNSGPNVTAILGNIPGGLELLPNKDYRTYRGEREWLLVTDRGWVSGLPKSNPYEEIYEIPAVVRPVPGQRPSTNAYWGLVDPDLLDPAQVSSTSSSHPSADDNNALDGAFVPTAWDGYLMLLGAAEGFHHDLGKMAHPQTFCFRGVGQTTADRVELRIESNWVRSDPYPIGGFRGFFTDEHGKDMQAVLRDADGDGDGTVPISSASAIDTRGRNKEFGVEHQPAYEDGKAQQYTVRSIIALCKELYNERTQLPLGDFPTGGTEGRG